MRSIVGDLKERLDDLRIRIREARKEVVSLESQEAMLMMLLKEEQRRWDASQAKLPIELFGVNNSGELYRSENQISKFILSKLRDGNEWPLGKLKLEAYKDKLEFGMKSPGRVLHFALVGMQQNKLVEMIEKGVWRIKGK